MKKYWSFFRMRFLGSLQYRAAAWAGIATQFAWGFMKLLMYRAFYEAGPAAFPMEFSQLATYIWLQQAFLMLFNTWRYDNDIFESITTGGVAYELSRPVPVYSMWFVKCIASRVASTALRCLPVLVVAFLLPAPYRLNPPESAGVFLVFLLSLAAASALVMALQMLVYIATFYTLSPLGVRIVVMVLSDFLMGQLIPLQFFPEAFRKVVELTPFAAMQNLPLQIYCGTVAGNALTQALALQGFWLIALVGCGVLWMRRSLRRVVVQGG
ncbi:MAG: ABC transporter permease [Christensenella sp.]|jgi:ABC-2 type transport system permease protein|nr:ABC transporter permease [Christensenella sp.]